MKNKKVGIIIVTYNAAQFIKACLDSVLQLTYHPYELLIIDNHSTDSTVSLIKKTFPAIDLVENKTNTGFAAANNQGIHYLQEKHCDYFLLLNPDTSVDKQLVNKLIEPFTDTKIGITGPVITYENKHDTIWFAGGIFNSIFCYTQHALMDKKLADVQLHSGKVGFITGACMMIRKDVIDKAGYLPEAYFLYFEDTFYCQKAQQDGFICYLVAKPLVRHRVSSSTGEANSNKMSALRSYYFARNPLLYIRKEVHGWRKITNFIGQFCIRLPRYLVKNILDGNTVVIWAYLKGIVNGLYSHPHENGDLTVRFPPSRE